MPIQLTGSLDVSGSILINGTAVTASGGGGGTWSIASELSALQASFTYTQILDVNTASAIYDLHISQSGIHYISSSIASPSSASINVYYYIDSLPSQSIATTMVSLPAGTAAVGLILRTITTGSSSTQYYVPSSLFNGTTNTSVNRTSGVVTPRAFVGAVGNPTVMSKTGDGTVFFGSNANPLLATGGQTYLYSGSIGSPIV